MTEQTFLIALENLSLLFSDIFYPGRAGTLTPLISGKTSRTMAWFAAHPGNHVRFRHVQAEPQNELQRVSPFPPQSHPAAPVQRSRIGEWLFIETRACRRRGIVSCLCSVPSFQAAATRQDAAAHATISLDIQRFEPQPECITSSK
jgi:hypothetical protein